MVSIEDQIAMLCLEPGDDNQFKNKVRSKTRAKDAVERSVDIISDTFFVALGCNNLPERSYSAVWLLKKLCIYEDSLRRKDWVYEEDK